LFGITGVLGRLDFFFGLEIFLFTPACVCVALLWTYILRNVEVLTIGALGYLAPLLFLFVDSHLLKTDFSLYQVVGIVALVMGGIAFSVDGETRRLKKEMTWCVASALLGTLTYNGVEAYFFKYMNSTYGVNGVSFFASVWLMSTLCLLALVGFRRRASLLFDATARAYAPRIAVSKTLDATSSVLTAQALSMAAVSQVSAFEALLPLISLAVVIGAQKGAKLKLNEQLSSVHMVWKSAAAGLLVAGGLLVK
ncbi:MAG: hypothetical protein ABL860_10070, partial [Candidatus Nitrotoga sp.]